MRRRKGFVIFTAYLLFFFTFVRAQIWQPPFASTPLTLYRRGDGHDGERDDVGRHTMIVQGLEASIDVDQEGYANIVVISVTDTNPIMARNLANRLAEV